MCKKSDRDEIKDHLLEVGLICTQWAYLEWLLEIALWWMLGILDKGDPADGRIMTGGLSIDTLARRVCVLSHRKLSDSTERQVFDTAKSRIDAILDERNLAVHGVRAVAPDNDDVFATVARGKYKSTRQSMALIRLRSLNMEIALITYEVEGLLARKGVVKVEGDDSSALDQYLPRPQRN